MQNVTWFQGWKIILRCAQFNCQDQPQFASTAILKHLPPPSDHHGIELLHPTIRSIVFPIEAFGTPAEANGDALQQAKRQILELNAAAN